MNMLKMCLNWKVLTGLGVAAAAVYILAPGAFAAALPTLLLLACPLSMLVMLVGMRRTSSRQVGWTQAAAQSAVALTREQQLAQLRTQLLGPGGLQADELEATGPPPVPGERGKPVGSSR